MKTADNPAFIVLGSHTAAVATIDDAGLPVTAAIDRMDCDKRR